MKANGGKEGGLSFFLEKIIFRGQLPFKKRERGYGFERVNHFGERITKKEEERGGREKQKGSESKSGNRFFLPFLLLVGLIQFFFFS